MQPVLYLLCKLGVINRQAQLNWSMEHSMHCQIKQGRMGPVELSQAACTRLMATCEHSHTFTN